MNWIYARNLVNDREDGDNGGKWLLFVKPNLRDNLWNLIKDNTEQGNLGCASKISVDAGNGCHVICVYTYDYKDDKDVRRVRDKLRLLGFEKKIPYKTDEATRNNVKGSLYFY